MLRKLLLLLLYSAPALAAPKPQPAYQDAVLKGFAMVADPDGSQGSVARYTITIGATYLVLAPVGFRFKNSCLYGLLPGTTIQIAPDGRAKYRIRAANKESEYRLVEAE